MAANHHVHLVHWNVAEATERAGQLRAVGFRVSCDPFTPALFRALRRRPPAAFVIDLSRLPSHGRDVALGLRQFKDTRHVPIVFVAGAPEKVAGVRTLLPDAVFATWRGIGSALRRAIARPPAAPIVPTSRLAGYSHTPLPKKLGIKADAVVALVAAPPDFERTLGALPAGTRLIRNPAQPHDLTLWFVGTRKELDTRITAITRTLGPGGLWIAWPKKRSGVESDLTQSVVRAAGLASGLVDYKICAIDATWSGLRFSRRSR